MQTKVISVKLLKLKPMFVVLTVVLTVVTCKTKNLSQNIALMKKLWLKLDFEHSPKNNC